jgi:hypothetical protein
MVSLNPLNWFRGAKFLEVFKTESANWKRPLDDYNQFDFREYSEKASKYFDAYPKVKSSVISVSGQVMAEGIFLTPATRRMDSGKKEPYPRSQEARRLCEELNERIRINELGFNIVLRMVKYGSCFLEKTHTPKFDVRLIPEQKYIRPTYNRDTGNQTGWELYYNGKAYRTWSMDEIVLFPLFPDENYPYGTGLITGLDEDLKTYDHIITGLKKWVERQAFATDVLQVGDKDYVPGATEVESLKRSIQNRTIGDTIVTNYSTGKQTLGGGNLESTTIPEVLKFIDEQLSDGLLAPPLSKLVSSTEASATEVMNWLRAIIITPIQRIVSDTLAKEVYWDYLESLGYSVNTVPTVNFNTNEAGKNAEADYWTKLVSVKVVSPAQAAEEIGIEYDEAYWNEQEKKAEKLQEEKTAQAAATGNVTPEKATGDVSRGTKPEEKRGPKPEVNKR